MAGKPVRTRYAPSPTGMMHVGNLRTALYEYLIARSMGGSFILRIEDTDQERIVPGAVDLIYRTMQAVGLGHDEGPDIGGPCGPYVQSERRSIYRPYAEQLVTAGKAYFCFCTHERLEQLRDAGTGHAAGYDRHCRDLDANTVRQLLDDGTPHVIRQKMPLTGSTSFSDAVYGIITVDNSELEDQVLLKSDGFPTYNFANVIDDHLMAITHVVRGSEYLSSTPKYNLLYESFGWEIPTYVHLPLIVGSDGKKLSKRHGSTSFEALVREGYLAPAIVNAIALLGWCPAENREIYSLPELCKAFSIDGISKSPSVFDYDKLAWFNASYIRAMPPDDFLSLIQPQLDRLFCGRLHDARLLAELLQPRLVRLTELDDMVRFLTVRQAVDPALYEHKKSKTTAGLAVTVLPQIRDRLDGLTSWSREALHDALTAMASQESLKTSQVMWPLRIALSGQAVTPGGAIEIAIVLGRDEAMARLQLAIDQLGSEISGGISE